MADAKDSAAPALTGANIATNDLWPIIDVSATLRKSVTSAEQILWLQRFGMPRVTTCTSQHSISSVTGTEVTSLQQTLEAGTFTFKYTLIVRSATQTVSPLLGVNFTGTGTPRMHFRFADATSAITAEVHTMDDQGVQTFGYISGMANAIETTTSPNMGTTATNAVATINTDTICFIEGILIASVGGDLELWHSSETATATSVEVGSALVVTRVV